MSEHRSSATKRIHKEFAVLLGEQKGDNITINLNNIVVGLIPVVFFHTQIADFLSFFGVLVTALLTVYTAMLVLLMICTTIVVHYAPLLPNTTIGSDTWAQAVVLLTSQGLLVAACIYSGFVFAAVVIFTCYVGILSLKFKLGRYLPRNKQ